jgi:hypothetical protein
MPDSNTEKSLQLVACPRPFSDIQVVRQIDAGGTVAEILIANGMVDILSGHLVDARIEIDGVEVLPEWWSRVRPKSGHLMTVRAIPAGGGDGGGKDVMRAVLMIGVIAASIWVGGLGFAAAPYLGGALGVLGSLAVNALIPPSAEDNQNKAITTSRGNSITGTRNTFVPYGPVPQVFGKRLIYPQYAAAPYAEYIGDEQYMRLLFLIGYGYYDLTDHKIGATAIASYDDVETQVYTPAAPLTAGNGLFPSTVYTETLSIELLKDAAHTETTQEDCDEIQVDIYWPIGLYYLTNDGNPARLYNNFTIEYSLTGEDDWTSISDTNARAKITRPFTKTFRVTVTNGQYDVRVTRLTDDGDSESNKHYDTTYWTALRTVTHKAAVELDTCTYVAMRIRASGQLNGVIDQYNVVATRKLPIYNTGTSTWSAVTATRNAAWAYCEVLRGVANRLAVADSRLDLTTIAAWAARMDTAGWTVDMVVDYETTPFALIKRIAAAGRASYGIRDMKFSVVEDIEQTTPRQHITPRNSWGFSAERTFVDLPHCLRVQFHSEDLEGYAEDELFVYADGYTSANATKFETLRIDDIVDPDLAWKIGRYHIAQAILRPWKYTASMDPEHLVTTRGDLVRLQHDSILAALGRARVKTVTLNGSSQATAITIDDAVTMAAGTTYGVQIRKKTGVEVTSTVNTVAGENTTLTFSSPIAAESVPEVGDLILFGESGEESFDCIIKSIRPGADLTATLELLDAAPDIHDADTGEIPAYDPNVTLPPELNRVSPPAPSIISVSTQHSLDESHGPAGRLEVVVYWSVSPPSLFQPPVYYFQAEYTYAPEDGTESQGPWRRIADIPADQRAAFFPVDLGAIYDFRVRSVSAQGGVSAWDTYDDYTASVDSWVGVNVAGLQVLGGGTSWTGRDCNIEWTATTHSRARGYKIVVANTSTSAVLREEYVEGINNTHYEYTYSMNYEDTGGGPLRALTFYVYVYDVFGTLSSSDPGDLATLAATNPAPDMSSGTPTVTAMTRGLKWDWRAISPSDADLSSFTLYVSKTQSDVTNMEASAIAATVGPKEKVWHTWVLDPGDTYYGRVLPYDDFGAGVPSQITSEEPIRLSSEDVLEELAYSITITDSDGHVWPEAT